MSGESFFYTLRRASSNGDERPIYELAKWADGEIRPTDFYIMWLPLREGALSFLSCNCPSRSQPCKHWEIAQALLEQLGEKDLARWLWQEGKVLPTGDVLSMEQVAKLFDH